MSGEEIDHQQPRDLVTPEKTNSRITVEDMTSKEGTESNSLQSTNKDTNASFTGSSIGENRPSLKNILMMINNQKSATRMKTNSRSNLMDLPGLIKLKSIASVASSNAGNSNAQSLQAQMANLVVETNPFEEADDICHSPMFAPLMPLEKIQSMHDDTIRKSCLAHCAREQEKAIERNLQWVLQSEVNSSHHGDTEIDDLYPGGEIGENETTGFDLPLNQELLGVGGRGLRDSDSLNDDLDEHQDQDEVIYAELLLNTLMRERSEVFGQAEKSLLYRSMLNQQRADNATAGPKFISSDQEEQEENDQSDDQLFQQAYEVQMLGQQANNAGSKFDTNRYFKPTVAPIADNQIPQNFMGLTYDQQQQLQLLHQNMGPFAPMGGFVPQQQNFMMPDFQQQDQFDQIEQVNIGQGVAMKPQSKSKISPSQKIFLPKVRFECCEKLNKIDVSCECILIDKVCQLEILDEILTLPQDEIVGINVQMNADVVNENFQIDVFGPSLLTLGTTFKTYIIDFVKLSTFDNQRALDGKLCHIFEQAHIIFAGFGVPTMITYFHQFHQNFCFLRYVPRIIDVRIMYHKVQRKGQRSFATIYQILFAKRLDITENLSDWEQRPLTANQLKQTGVEVQSLLRMIYKLDRLSKTKDKARFRVYMHEIISKVDNFHYIDNPLVYNKFTKADLKISAMNRRMKLNKPQNNSKGSKKEQHKDQPKTPTAKNTPPQQKAPMPAPQAQINTEQDCIQQAQEQLRLFELVEQMTGVKMMPPAAPGVEQYQQPFPMQNMQNMQNMQKMQNMQNNMIQNMQYVPPDRQQQMYANFVPVQQVQMATMAPMMVPQPQPMVYVPVTAPQQNIQVLDSQVLGESKSKEASFTEKNLANVRPFSPTKKSQNASMSSSIFQESNGNNAKSNNFSSIYEDMQDINKYQRKDSNQSQKYSQKDSSDIQSANSSSKQQSKSKSGVFGNQKMASERKGGDNGGSKSLHISQRNSEDKKQMGSVNSSDRHVFRKKQKSQVGSTEAPDDDSNSQFQMIQQHAKHIQHEQRKLSKEARAREKKIMQEQHKRKKDEGGHENRSGGGGKGGKAPVKSARVAPMSAASLQQQTGYPVQVKQRQRRQKAQVKEPTSEQDERLQRQALADQKRRMIKEMQEQEEALQKLSSETQQNSEDNKGESEQQMA